MNTVGIITAWMFSIDRTLLNLDYALVFVLAASPWRRPWLIFTMILGLFVLEWYYVISKALFFFDIRDLVELAKGEAVPVRFLVQAAVGVVLILAVAAFVSWHRFFARRIVAVALVSVLVFAAVVEKGQRQLFGYSDQQANHVFTPALWLALRLANPDKRELLIARLTGGVKSSLVALEEPSKVYTILREAAESEEARPLVLVFVESWGYESDAETAALVRESLSSRLEGRSIRTGVDASFGVTVAGEFRVLCNARLQGVRVPRDQITDDCLPRVVTRFGGVSKSFHGYDALFYRRETWYPDLGFQSSFWRSSIPGEQCEYAFRHVCDGSLIAFLRDQVETDRKGFYYALTLGTHLPFVPDARKDALQYADAEKAGDDYGVYRLLLRQLLVHVGEAAQEFPEALFVISGDHPPYLFRNFLKEERFAVDRVPYVVIEPAAPVGGAGFVTTRAADRQ